MLLWAVLLSSLVVSNYARTQIVMLRYTIPFHYYRSHLHHLRVYCVAAGANFTPLTMQNCPDHPDYQFIISDEGVSTIRQASLAMCLETSGCNEHFGTVSFEPCSGLPNQSFKLPKPSTWRSHVDGEICMASSPDCCLGLYTATSLDLIALEWHLGFYDTKTDDYIDGSKQQFRIPTPQWAFITASESMWLGSRSAEAVMFRGMFCHLSLIAAVYIIYVIGINRRLVLALRSWGAAASCIWFYERIKITSRRILKVCGLRDVDATSDEVASLYRSFRLQRAQLYSNRLLHAFGIYAAFKAHQMWVYYNLEATTYWGLCSDDVSACNAWFVRQFIYNYEYVPMYLVCFPGLCLIVWLGQKLQAWHCDMLIILLFVGWCLQAVSHCALPFGDTSARMIVVRFVQLIVFGNPKLASFLNVLIFLVEKACLYGFCYSSNSGPKWPECKDLQNPWRYFGFDGQYSPRTYLECIFLCLSAACLHVLESVHIKRIIAKRKEDASAISLSMLQKHLDVLYDCVVHIDACFDISVGTPKLAGLLLRGAVNLCSLKDRHLPDLMYETDRQRFIEHMEDVSLTGNVGVLHVSFVDGYGGLVPCELYTVSASSIQGRCLYMVGIKETVMPESRREVGHCDRDQQSVASGQQGYLGSQIYGACQSAHSDNSSLAEVASEAVCEHAARHDVLGIDEEQVCESTSVASISVSSASAAGGGDLWLTLSQGADGSISISECSFALLLVLGKDVVGSRIDDLTCDKMEFEAWLKKAVTSARNGTLAITFTAKLNKSTWRPMCMRATFSLASVALDGDTISQMRIEVLRVRYDTRMGGPSVSKKRHRSTRRAL